MPTLQYDKLTNRDLHKLLQLVALYEEVFGVKQVTFPHASHLQTLLEDNHILFYAAILEGQVIGGLTAYVLPSVYFESSEVYLYDLAVKSDYQRKGIGRELLSRLNAGCAQLGYREVFVQADTEDAHAIDFYHATGGLPENVIHFSYNLQGEKHDQGIRRE